jgi:PAS domain S-box-containing protein/putative nucleotidyltransferase with HDIG domain
MMTSGKINGKKRAEGEIINMNNPLLVSNEAKMGDTNKQVNKESAESANLVVEALMDSETRYRRLFETAQDGILILDGNTGEITDVNPFLQKMLGISSEEFLGKKPWEISSFKNIMASPNAFLELQKKEHIRYEDILLENRIGRLMEVEFVSNVYLVGNKQVIQCNIRDITERKQAEELQDAIYRIAQAADRADSLDALYPAIHAIIQEIMVADNFYIALYDEINDLLSFPYSVDEVDPQFPSPRKPGKGLTEYVLHTGKSVLCDEDLEEELMQHGEIELVGVYSPVWLGVPLIVEGKVIGVMAVQDYKNARAYEEREQRILEFVSSQAAMVIHRKRAEEALRESEEKYRNVVERANDGITIIQDTIVKYLNPHLAELWGGTVEEVIGTPFADFIHPDELPVVLDRYQRRMAGEDVSPTYETVLKRKDGSKVYVELNTGTIMFQGEPADLAIVRDITERKQTQTLEEAVYRIAAAAETTRSLDELYPQIHQIISSVMPAENLYITLYDEAQNFLRFPYFKDAKDEPFMGGIQPGKGLTAYVLRTGKSLLCTQAVHDELERQGEVKLLGVPSAIWLGVPLIVEGKTIGAIVVQHYSDPKAYGEREQHMLEFVSTQVAIAINRKWAEEALRQAEKNYRSLFENVPDGVYRSTPAGKFLSVNPALVKIFGFSSAKELLGVDISRDLFIHPKERQSWAKALLEKGELRNAESAMHRKDGQQISVLENTQLIRDAQGNALYFEGTLTDITERKQREEEIQSRTEELATLYQLSRLLTDANNLENVFELVNRHAVESVHITFACLALLEEGELVTRAVYPVRILDHEFIIGDRQPITALPVCQRVLDKNEPVILRAGSPEVGNIERTTLMFDFVQSVCLVPLRVSDATKHFNQALGLLILGEAREEKREPFTPEKIRLARNIGDQAAAAILRMQLREQADRRLQHLASLGEIDRIIASTFDLRISLQMILKHISEQLEVDAVDVLVFNHHMQTLEFAAGRGFRSKIIERTRLRPGEGQAGQAALERRIIQIPDVATSGVAIAQLELIKAENVAAYFAVPLITKGQVMGVLEIYHRTALDPNEEWLNFLETLAGQAAIAIDNAQMFDSLQQSTDELELAYDATIEGWSHALDLRDKETEGHTLRVAEMTVNLARTLGLSELELVNVRWGALLHDIGKMGVPDGILFKPGPLTDEEWVVMKKHPTLAYEMLSPIRYLHTALDIPYCHHEWWDGTGYPRGLKGEQIPLTARIFAVVDVWDALISDRSYRQAWSKGKARQHILTDVGVHFDPQVVKIFILEDGRINPSVAKF